MRYGVKHGRTHTITFSGNVTFGSSLMSRGLISVADIGAFDKKVASGDNSMESELPIRLVLVDPPSGTA